MPWTCGKNTCPSRYTFFGKGCKESYSEDLKEPPGQAIVTVKIGHELYLKKNTMTRPLLTGAA